MPRLRIAPPRLPLALAAAAFSGILLWLALPPVDAWPLGLVALVPLLWAVRGSRARRGALLGFVQGLVFYAVMLSWLIPLTVLGWVVLVTGVAAWLALFGAYAAAAWRDRTPVRTALAIGAGWAVVEWLRGLWPFGGWHWTGLGYTQHENPLLMPLAPLVGAMGIALVVAAVSALALAVLLRVGEWRRAIRPAAVTAILVLMPWLFPMPSAKGPPVDVAIVQGNLPEGIATRTRIIENRVVAENHAEVHLRMRGDPPDLAVWAENALDDDPTRDPFLAPLVVGTIEEVGAPALVGAITHADDGRLLNESLLYDERGVLVDRYAKNGLLPFGEYVPFREHLEWIPDIQRIRTDLSPGTTPGRFRIPAGSFGAIICFENAFPNLVRRWLTADETFLVVSTNNSTFGRTPAPEQHLVLSKLRAAENGRWTVHAALTGISAIITPGGKVVARTDIFEQALLRGEIRQAQGRTIFNLIGGWLPWALLLIALAGLPIRRRERPRSEPLPPDPETVVVLPTYNERETIAEAIARVLSAGERIHVIVVDDSSPDGTGEIVRGLGKPRVTLVERPDKRGLADAYRDGFARALERGADLIVEMDADLSHRPEELPAMLEAARSNDLVVGSRYVPGGSVRNWGLVRRFLSRGGNLYARLTLGFPVADATSGYRVYRRELLRELMAEGIRSDGYAFQIELAYRAWRLGYDVGESPITFEERRAGESKLSRAIVAEALWRVLLWGIRDRFVRRRPAEPAHGVDERHPERVQ